ncbi:hypothetical protein [Cohnella sp. GCM10027633]|uniref:hypothetical protein n=1 Tax=unclassified Cohnella TaxID=2636738 RepID=UPI0036455E1D
MLDRLYGIDMLLPPSVTDNAIDSALAELGEIALIVDRHGELLAFERREAADIAIATFKRHGIDSERCELLRLPREATPLLETGALYGDYAIETSAGNVFFDVSLTASFALDATKPEAEPAPALLQLEEHLIGSLRAEEGSLHLIDRQLANLAERVARAYGCAAIWRY